MFNAHSTEHRMLYCFSLAWIVIDFSKEKSSRMDKNDGNRGMGLWMNADSELDGRIGSNALS